MKMIEVLDLMAKGKIKEGTKLKIGYKIYDYINDYTGSGDCSFVNQEDDGDTPLEDDELITKSFLNYEVELIPPKEKKYLVKINLRWLGGCRKYLKYNEINERVYIQDNINSLYSRLEFTKQELQSIKSVREFLEDIEGKYELIEVEENEAD